MPHTSFETTWRGMSTCPHPGQHCRLHPLTIQILPTEGPEVSGQGRLALALVTRPVCAICQRRLLPLKLDFDIFQDSLFSFGIIIIEDKILLYIQVVLELRIILLHQFPEC